jgi:hypothetical protein
LKTTSELRSEMRRVYGSREGEPRFAPVITPKLLIAVLDDLDEIQKVIENMSCKHDDGTAFGATCGELNTGPCDACRARELFSPRKGK